jgi:hypothetical protein
MDFTLCYHQDVRTEDLPLIDSRTKARIRKAIEERLKTAPHEYGEPLRKNLKGYWKPALVITGSCSKLLNPRYGFLASDIENRFTWTLLRGYEGVIVLHRSRIGVFIAAL